MYRYEDRVSAELAAWERSLAVEPGLLERTSKAVSLRINRMIPEKVRQAITAAVKTIVRTTLWGAEYAPKRKVQDVSLEQADRDALETISLYQKIAAAEGAGTGAGGILMSAVDFPALIAIKMKLLFELAHVYGCDTGQFSERIFLLHLFHLTYAEPPRRRRILDTIKRWHTEKDRWSSESAYVRQLDWDAFQQDYRDAIDFRKMLQMLPGIGAAVGAWANYSLLKELGECAMNAYRLRRLNDPR